MRTFIKRLAGPLDWVTKRRPEDRRGQHSHSDGGHHAGLLLQRYLCENATGEDGNSEEKRAILQAARNAASNRDVQAFYKFAFDRWSASLPPEPPPVDLATAGRLIIGLGSESVLETGIRLHHTYGMPILPGSALKGLAAHYCAQVWATDARFKKPSKEEDEAYRKYLAGRGPKPEDNFHRFLFGTTDDSGCITFHDAWYVPDASCYPLVLDVMTPHHPKWNNVEKPVAPTDFDSPTPIPFLSVSGRFRVAVSWHGPVSYKANSWSKLALSLLRCALSNWGIGGKTSSGYGRLVDAATIALQESDTSKPGATQFVAPTLKLPAANELVEAKLVERREKGNNKISWRAEHSATRIQGPIQNSDAVPSNSIMYKTLELFVAYANDREIAFKFPTPEIREVVARLQSKTKDIRSRKGKQGHNRS